MRLNAPSSARSLPPFPFPRAGSSLAIEVFRTLAPLQVSKVLAEKAAWEFARANGLDVVVVNPGFVLGPPLSARTDSTSVQTCVSVRPSPAVWPMLACATPPLTRVLSHSCSRALIFLVAVLSLTRCAVLATMCCVGHGVLCRPRRTLLVTLVMRCSCCRVYTLRGRLP